MADYKFISADDHVFEPPDLWTTRVEPKYRDRAPRITPMEDGSEFWVCDGVKGMSMAGGSQAGLRFEDPSKLNLSDKFENVRPGGYIPEEHLKDMDADGIDVSLLYPNEGLLLYSVPDSDLLTSLCNTYNDWILEFCAPCPARHKGIAMINTDDMASGVKEMERSAKMGLIGALISVFPPDTSSMARSYDSPEYEPLWAAAQDLEMPLSLHLGTNRPGPGQEFASSRGPRPAFHSTMDHWPRTSLGHMIFSGVFERYPRLQVITLDFEASWVPYFLDRLDYTYTQRPRNPSWYRFKENMLPSQYFHRNVLVGFQEDALAMRDRDIIGVDNLVWGSDYPHTEGTFPRSRQILDEITADFTEEEKAKVVGGNAERIYRLD